MYHDDFDDNFWKPLGMVAFNISSDHVVISLVLCKKQKFLHKLQP